MMMTPFIFVIAALFLPYSNGRNNEQVWTRGLVQRRQPVVTTFGSDAGDLFGKYQAALARLTAAHLQLAEYAKAMEVFEKLAYPGDHLENIVTHTYGPEYFENLATFGQILHSSSDRIRVFSWWNGLIQHFNHFGLHACLIPNLLINEEARLLGASAPQNLLNLKKSINSKVASIIIPELTTSIIRIGGNITAVAEMFSPPNRNALGLAYQSILEDVLDAAYENTDAAVRNAVANFVFLLRWNMHKAIGLRWLVDQLQLSEDQSRLYIAFKVKAAIESLYSAPGPDPTTEARAILTQVKNSLKPQIRGIVWHTSCTLASTKAYPGEYLQATTRETYGPGSGIVFTSPNIKFDNEARFRFIPEKDDNSLTVNFRPQSLSTLTNLTIYMNPYVGVSSLGWDRWRVEPVSSNQLRLSHATFGNYLMVGSQFVRGEMREVIMFREVTSASILTLSCTE